MGVLVWCDANTLLCRISDLIKFVIEDFTGEKEIYTGRSLTPRVIARK